MAVPDFQTMMLPVLTALADSKPRSVREVSAIVAKSMSVSEADLQERLPSGYTTKWANRIAWVGTHFNFAGLITRPARAQMQITERGLRVLKDNPMRVDLKVLQQFSDYQNARRRKKEDGETVVEEEPVIPPLETLENSDDELRKALCAELLELIKSKPPIFFEGLAGVLPVVARRAVTAREIQRDLFVLRHAIHAQIPPARPAALRVVIGHEADDARSLVHGLDLRRAALEVGADAQLSGVDGNAKK